MPEEMIMDPQLLAFTGIAALLTIFVQRVRATLLRPRFKRALEALAGAALIAFGVRLALA